VKKDDRYNWCYSLSTPHGFYKFCCGIINCSGSDTSCGFRKGYRSGSGVLSPVSKSSPEFSKSRHSCAGMTGNNRND
jgi:hypothetical protein